MKKRVPRFLILEDLEKKGNIKKNLFYSEQCINQEHKLKKKWNGGTKLKKCYY